MKRIEEREDGPGVRPWLHLSHKSDFFITEFIVDGVEISTEDARNGDWIIIFGSRFLGKRGRGGDGEKGNEEAVTENQSSDDRFHTLS